MRERVQFAHMKFGAEEKRVNRRALKIAGKRVEFSTNVGQMSFVQSRDNDAAALDADFEAVKRSGHIAKPVVSLIQRVENLGVGIVIEATRA
jgi:hypothetical protein